MQHCNKEFLTVMPHDLKQVKLALCLNRNLNGSITMSIKTFQILISVKVHNYNHFSMCQPIHTQTSAAES